MEVEFIILYLLSKELMEVVGTSGFLAPLWKAQHHLDLQIEGGTER